jgi:peptidoglycan/xylan/chitin deacetylase (PgdA/CDA1 family)
MIDDLLVLSYHAVSSSWPAALSVTPRRFEEQVSRLMKRGYRGLTLGGALRERLAGRYVVFTFDDGYRSVLTHAAPVLARAGIPATVFVVTDLVGGGPMLWPGIEQWATTSHLDELRSLTWSEVGELSSAGWEIGSHTRSHPYLTSLGDDALREELVGSRRELERRLQVECASIAYPYGDHDARVLLATQNAGYEFGCTVPRRLTAPKPLAWPRVGIYHDNRRSTVAFKMSPLGRRLRGSGAWAVVEALRGHGWTPREIPPSRE